MSSIPVVEPPRLRVSLELSPSVSLLLDHIAELTGASKVQIVNAALLEALPGLLERADLIGKRSQALTQSHTAAKRR
jgi:hypothetical protein